MKKVLLTLIVLICGVQTINAQSDNRAYVEVKESEISYCFGVYVLLGAGPGNQYSHYNICLKYVKTKSGQATAHGMDKGYGNLKVDKPWRNMYGWRVNWENHDFDVMCDITPGNIMVCHGKENI